MCKYGPEASLSKPSTLIGIGKRIFTIYDSYALYLNRKKTSQLWSSERFAKLLKIRVVKGSCSPEIDTSREKVLSHLKINLKQKWNYPHVLLL